MKNSILFALLMSLSLETLSRGQVKASGSPRSWSDDLQDAADLNRRGEYRQARQSYQRLLFVHPISSDSELRAYVASQIADTEIELGEYSEAEARMRDAMATLIFAEKIHTSTFAVTEGVLAEALRAQGNYYGAQELAEPAVIVAKETMGPLHPRFAILLTGLASVLVSTRDLHRAANICRRAISIFEQAKETHPIELGSAYQNLAVVYAVQGKGKPALNALDRALANWNQALPPSHPFLVYGLSTKLILYMKLKDFNKAEEIISETLDLARSQFAHDHLTIVVLLNNAASVYGADKKYQPAEPLAREAAEIAKRRFRSGHALLRKVLLNYAYILARLDRREESSRVRAETELVLASPQQSITALVHRKRSVSRH